MFILCPHCHFLVGVDPRTGAPPALCPKCGGALGSPAGVDEGLAPPALQASAGEVPRSAGPGTSAAPVQEPVLPAPAAEATPAPRSTSPSPRDADAFIAAMAAKPARRTGGVRRKTGPSPEDTAASQEAAAPPASTRAPRTRRRPTPEPAVRADAASSAPAPAVAKPPGKATPWWSRLLGAWRARTAKAAAAKAAATAAPPDPLAASVRNRARARRAEGSSIAQAPSTVAPTAALVETTPQAVAPVPSADDGHAPSPATPEGAQQVAQEVAREIAPAPGVAVAAAPAAPLAETDAGTPVAETAAPIAPFVERRRNPDLPIPPGSVPTHPLRRRTDAPSFARPQPIVAAVRRDWRWPAAVAALSLLLVLQLLLAQRDSLAADARWRPMVSSLCAVLRCSLPPWREPGAFTMLGRDVRAHPSAPGALLIHASFRNDARWPQPWPQVLLTLSNVDGRVVGARAFAAREYLEADAAQAHELAPGQTAAISLAVVEPAPDIVAFSFDFR